MNTPHVSSSSFKPHLSLNASVSLPSLELGCGLGVTLVLMLLLFVIYHVFWLELLLLYRSWFGTDERHTGKQQVTLLPLHLHHVYQPFTCKDETLFFFKDFHCECDRNLNGNSGSFVNIVLSLHFIFIHILSVFVLWLTESS